MSLATRRTLSWIGTLAVLAAGSIGVARLPGSGGLSSELRWLFGWPSSANTNRAHVLFQLAARQAPHSQISILESLLSDSDPVAQQAGLSLSVTMVLGATSNPPMMSRREALGPFLHWLARVPPEKRLRFDPYPLLIAELPGAEREATGLLTATDLGWMIAGTGERGLDWRERADALVFRRAPAEPGIRQRLLMLDALQPIPGDLAPLTPEDVAAELVPTSEQLLALLGDADTRVSWNAGRILAVSGDSRGVPGVRRWLQWNPQMATCADKLMTALYGPDWRDLCESGSPARESGPRDSRR
jgi:hypothetical protein